MPIDAWHEAQDIKGSPKEGSRLQHAQRLHLESFD